MRLKCLLFIIVILVSACGGNGGNSDDAGSGGCSYPALIFAPGVQVLITEGSWEEVESPYAIDGFEEGNYFMQLIVEDNPLNFYLRIFEDGCLNNNCEIDILLND